MIRLVIKFSAKIKKVSKISQKINSETVTNKYDKEIPKEKIYISRRKTESYW